MTIDYNEPSSWLNEAVYRAPAGVDMVAFQEKLDEICGKAFNGWSNVRLVWGASPETSYNRQFCKWEGEYGIETHLRARYCYFSHDDGQTIIDVPAPRFALEQYNHPAQYVGGDEVARWSMMTDSFGIQSRRELRPRHSTEGLYTPLMVIADHKECAAFHKRGKTCWGSYRTPDESYLKVLEQAVHIRDQEYDQRPDEPISLRTLQRAALEVTAQQEAKKQAADEAMDEYVNENMLEIMEQITGQSFKDKLPAWSLPSNTKKENGIITLN